MAGHLILIDTKNELCLNYGSELNYCCLSTSCSIPLRLRLTVYRSIRIQELDNHTLQYDMAQPTGYSKKPLNINPFWEKASVEPPLEWSKWAAILKMAVFTKEGIEKRNLLRARPPLIEPSEPVYEIEINGQNRGTKKPRSSQSRETSWLGKSRH